MSGPLTLVKTLRERRKRKQGEEVLTPTEVLPPKRSPGQRGVEEAAADVDPRSQQAAIHWDEDSWHGRR